MCAKLLRGIYDGAIKNCNVNKELEDYRELVQWMERPLPDLASLETIADVYHEHLKNAHISIREHNFLPPVHSKDRDEGEPFWPIAIFLDKLRSSHNVGSIFRTTEAFGLGEIFLSKGTPTPHQKQVRDTAMGTSEWVKWSADADLKLLPKPIIAMETSPWAVPIEEFIFPEAFTLVVGNEEKGCSETTLKLADHLIAIPLRGRKNSLNVANAFAIAAAEICKQRVRGSP